MAHIYHFYPVLQFSFVISWYNLLSARPSGDTHSYQSYRPKADPIVLIYSEKAFGTVEIV